jgi:hypothetical protein
MKHEPKKETKKPPRSTLNRTIESQRCQFYRFKAAEDFWRMAGYSFCDTGRLQLEKWDEPVDRAEAPPRRKKPLAGQRDDGPDTIRFTFAPGATAPVVDSFHPDHAAA